MYNARAHQMLTTAATKPRITTVLAVQGTRETRNAAVSFCFEVSMILQEKQAGTLHPYPRISKFILLVEPT
jgi:hypothetical protein